MIYKFIRAFGHLIHHVWPYSLSQRFSRYYAWLYTAWIACNFRKIGLHTKIEPGLYLVNGRKYIEIGEHCIIGRNSAITAHETPQYKTSVKISIGNGCMFGSDMHITAVNSIRIGKYVRTGKSILISDNSHGDPNDKTIRAITPNARPIYSKGKVVIGDNVCRGESSYSGRRYSRRRSHHRRECRGYKRCPPILYCSRDSGPNYKIAAV